MSDENIRALERKASSDPVARYRFRAECVRQGRAELANFETGDIVSVVEADAGSNPPPAIKGRWIGVLEMRSTRYGKDSHEHTVKGRYLPFVIHPLQPHAAEWALKIIGSEREPEGGAPVHVMRGDLVSLLEPIRPDFTTRPYYLKGWTEVVRVTPEGLKLTTCCCAAAGASRKACAKAKKNKTPCRCYCHSLKITTKTSQEAAADLQDSPELSEPTSSPLNRSDETTRP